MTDLLIKYIAKETTAEETRIVALWIAENPDNFKTYMQLKSIWLQTEMPTYNGTNNQWEKLQSVINKNPKPVSKKVFLYRTLSIAASVIILITFSILYTIQKQSVIQIKTGNNSEYVVLPDSSKVHLSANSQLTYSENFTGTNRQITFEGIAYFEITKDSTRKFIINTPDLQITVLGTSFELNCSKNQNADSVFVTSGKVLVNTPEDKTGIIVTPLKYTVLNKQKKQLTTDTVTATTFLKWRKSNLWFNNTPLNNVVFTLEKVYNMHITIENPEIESLRLTSVYKNQTPENIMQSISLAFNIRAEYSQISNTWIIRK